MARPIPLPSRLCCHALKSAGPFLGVPRTVSRKVGHAWSPYPHQVGGYPRLNEGAGPEPGSPLCLETRLRGGHSPLAVLGRRHHLPPHPSSPTLRMCARLAPSSRPLPSLFVALLFLLVFPWPSPPWVINDATHHAPRLSPWPPLEMTGWRKAPCLHVPPRVPNYA